MRLDFGSTMDWRKDCGTLHHDMTDQERYDELRSKLMAKEQLTPEERAELFRLAPKHAYKRASNRT